MSVDIYDGLKEILLGNFFQPGSERVSLETFGKRVCETGCEVLPCVYKAAENATPITRHQILKDITVLLLKKEENFLA